MLNRTSTFTLIAFFTCFVLLPWHGNTQENGEGKSGKVEASYVKEIEQLAKAKPLQAAFQSILGQTQRNRNELIMLTEIPAPPFMETKRGERFASMLKEAGADSVWTDKEGNVLALRKGKKTHAHDCF